MVEVQTQVRVASGVEAIVVKAADRVEPLDSECNTWAGFDPTCVSPINWFETVMPLVTAFG